MKTRDKILMKALELMNVRGMDNVSTYDIARELNIRQSNITYYFATKSDIMHALGMQMVEEANALVGSIDPVSFSMETFYRLMEKTMKMHERYRFILMNYAAIVTVQKELQQYYNEVLTVRPGQMEVLLRSLDANGYVYLEDVLPRVVNLTLVLNMVSIYWVQESAIYMEGKSDKHKRKHHITLVFEVLLPYLTPKGRAELDRLLAD